LWKHVFEIFFPLFFFRVEKMREERFEGSLSEKERKRGGGVTAKKWVYGVRTCICQNENGSCFNNCVTLTSKLSQTWMEPNPSNSEHQLTCFHAPEKITLLDRASTAQQQHSNRASPPPKAPRRPRRAARACLSPWAEIDKFYSDETASLAPPRVSVRQQ
jgi:hypothetical protein